MRACLDNEGTNTIHMPKFEHGSVKSLIAYYGMKTACHWVVYEAVKQPQIDMHNIMAVGSMTTSQITVSR